jgi:type IV pilus assembly protein PilM
LSQQLRDRMHVDVDIANPFAEIDTSMCDEDPDKLSEMSALAAVGVGLALRTVGDR